MAQCQKDLRLQVLVSGVEPLRWSVLGGAPAGTLAFLGSVPGISIRAEGAGLVPRPESPRNDAITVEDSWGYTRPMGRRGGFSGAGQRVPADLLVGRGLTVTLSGRRTPVLRDLDVSVGPSEVVGLFGRSGSGKSTLLRVINGLIPWLVPGEVTGEIKLGGESLDDLDPGQRAHLMGSCLDRPEAQLFLPTVRQEMVAARRLYGEGRNGGAVEERLGIGPLMDRRVVELSSGERQRVALAAALTAGARPVLLDEPTAHLDLSGTVALAEALNEMSASGGAVIAADHGGWRLGSGVSRWLELEGGKLTPGIQPAAPEISPPKHQLGERVVFEARGFGVAVGGRRLFEPIDLEIHEGEIVVLSGDNGVGKSTLARAMAGHAAVERGSCHGLGDRHPALMMPEAELQLFSSTVESELRACGAPIGEVARVLRRHRLEAFAARTPWSLSRGERQRLVHAAHDVLQPKVLIIDEPAQGLDAQDVVDFLELVARRAARGRAYVIITHRTELAMAAHRHLRLSPAGLEEVGR